MTERQLRVRRFFAIPVVVGALLVVPSLILERPGTSSTAQTLGNALNWAIWLIFTAELVVTTWVAPKRLVHLRSHPLKIAIVLLTPPFLPAGLQVAGLIRLVALARLARAAPLLQRLRTGQGLRDAGAAASITVILGGALFSLIENEQDLSTWDGIWWAIATVTTVGYGDIYPKTGAGRVLATGVMVVGIGFVALLTAAAADAFVNGKDDDEDDSEEPRVTMQELADRLDRIETQLRERG